MNHPANYLRHNRPVEKFKSCGKSKLIVRKYTEPKGSVLEAARRFKRDVLKLAIVDGERQ